MVNSLRSRFCTTDAQGSGAESIVLMLCTVVLRGRVHMYKYVHTVDVEYNLRDKGHVGFGNP